jgi:hypothetical protein
MEPSGVNPMVRIDFGIRAATRILGAMSNAIPL